ncbi:MAG: VCBS repeat-containing protein [Bacteroidota bacterium]
MKNISALYFFFSLLLFFSCENEKPGPVLPENTLFELIPPAHSGVDFVQTITEEYRYNFSVDANIFNGGGVGILDVNNDGLQDLFFTSRLQPCKLYLNKGDFKFEDISATAGITEFIGIKTGVTIVDINADGWQDVYVCRTFLQPDDIRRNLLFVNNQDNTFTEKGAEYGLDDISPTQHAHFFDYDLDGDLDCYVLNHPVNYKQINTIDFQPSEKMPFAGMRPPLDEYESDKLYRNENGKFTDVSREAGIFNRAWGLSVMSADINDDGLPDLYVSNDFIMPDFLYINNGDGTFSDKIHDYFQHITNHAMGIEIADLNNDGLPEIAALDMLGENWERRHRQLTTMQLERYKQLIRQGYGDQQMRNTLQLNNGNNHFSEIGCLANMFDTEWSWAPLAADFDSDGWKDLFITNGVRRDLNDIDFFVFTADSINRTGGINESRFKKFEDFSNLMPSQKIKNRMFKNNGTLDLKDVTMDWGFSQPTFSNGAAYTDLDNDGDLDLVTHNIDDVPFIYKNNSTKNNWLQIRCKGTPENPVGVGAKIKVYQNGKLIAFQEMSPLRGFYSSVEPVFQVGLGSINTVDLIEIIWPEGKHQVLEKVNANQYLTLDIKSATDGKIADKPARPLYFEKIENNYFKHRENSFEDFNVQFLLPHRFSNQGPAMTVGDVNGDQLEDFYIGGAAASPGAVFIQNKSSGFFLKENNVFESNKNNEDTGALFFDADNDGDQDLYVVSGGNERPINEEYYLDRLYLNDGDGNFTKSNNLPKIKNSGKAIAAHDFDNDGDLDLFIGGRVVPGRFPEVPQSFILENENGIFKNITEEVFPEFKNIGMVTDLHFANINNEEKKELIIAGEWMPISIYEFKDGKFSPSHLSPSLRTSSGWWNCVETADLDGDGDLDLLAGNLGLNSRYEAPLYLYANDFDNNGSIDPILCVEENGRIIPVPMRDELIKQLPSLKKKFVRNTAYAKTDINGVFTKTELASARQLKAEELASCWFENKGNELVKHQLPGAAQIAPVFGVTVADVNHDGNPDILLVGNDSGFDVQTGPLDTSAGVLLMGNGNGAFEPVLAGKSGFFAVDEARGIYPIKDIKGASLFLIPNNDNDLLIFKGK